MMPVDNEKIKVFDSDDQSLKFLGELLSNDTSRKILKVLIDDEMYTNQIAKKLDLRVSLVIHHLNKMKEIGIVEINHKKISKKGNDHKHYTVIPGLFVMPNESKEAIQEKGTLKKIFKDGVKFATIGIAFIGSSIFSKNYFETSEINYPIPFGIDVPHIAVSSLEFWIYPLIVLVVALITERIIFGIKKRKKG